MRLETLTFLIPFHYWQESWRWRLFPCITYVEIFISSCECTMYNENSSWVTCDLWWFNTCISTKETVAGKVQFFVDCFFVVFFLVWWWENKCWWLLIIDVNWIVLEVHVLGVEEGENLCITADWLTHDLCLQTSTTLLF